MLSEHQFWEQIERLSASFGERFFMEGRMSSIFPFVRPLSVNEFSNAITHLIDESQMPPTPAKIKEACRPLVDRATQREQSLARESYQTREAEHWCEFCGNTGIITAKMKGEIYV